METVGPCENIPVSKSVTYVLKEGTTILGKSDLELQ